MKRVISVILMILFMTVIILSGCNGNKNTIKIGILGPHTGEYAKYGLAVKNGAMMYIDKINAEGGINGKQIQAIVYDQKGNSEESITAFNLMVDKGITALIGDVLTDNTIAVVGEAHPKNMPMITASATAAAVTYNAETKTVYQNVFRACFIDPFQGTKMAQYAKEKLNANTAAIIFQTGNDYAVGLKDAFIEKANELGLEIVATEGYAKGDKEFRSQLTNIKGTNPDVVFAPNYYEYCAMIVSQARDIGLDALFLGGDGWASITNYANDVSVLEGSIYCSAFAPGATEAMTNFEKEYVEKYGSESFNMFSALGYDAAVILVDALKKAEEAGHETGSDEYKQAVIDAMKNTNVEGITGSYEFDEYNNPIKDAVIVKIENGKEVFLETF